MAFELRETDASKQDWSTFSDEKAFAKYTMDIAQTVNCADHIFWYVSKREFSVTEIRHLENHRQVPCHIWPKVHSDQVIV